MVLAALVLLGAVCAAGLIGFVYYKETHLPPVGEFDTIIVLGAQVKADGTPSVALERRLTAALEEYRKQPRLMIVCGAQGSDEPRAEGDVMRDWLIAHGVAAADIEAETDSFNTRQNLGYAQSIMDDRGLTAALIVTSDYHVPRALALCEQVGIIASGKGILVGGKYTALEDISASVIGSDNYTKTMITLGNNAVLSEEIEGHKHKVAELEDKLDQLGKIVTTLTEMAKVSKLSPQREQMKVEAMRSRFQIQGEIKRLNNRIAEIETTLERKQNLSISCKKAFYPGVTLRINSYVYPVNVMTPHSKATISDNEIVMIPL